MARRLLRFALNALAVLSLLLCAAACVLWARSYWVADFIGYEHYTGYRGSKRTAVISQRGAMQFVQEWEYEFEEEPGFYWNTVHDDLALVASTPGWRAFAAEDRVTLFPSPRREREVVVPHWLVILLTAVLPVRWAWRLGRRRHRGRMNLCPVCGYDLRATPGRCPECGASAPDWAGGRSG